MEAHLGVLLDGRPLCPPDAPFANAPVCCAHATAVKAAYQHARALREMHSTARRAAELLRQKRVVVVGDSISQQWANALLLDLRGRGFLANSSWPRTVSNLGLPPNTRPFHREHQASRMYCDGLPAISFRGVASSSSSSTAKQQVPTVQYFSLHTHTCGGTHAGCCRGDAPPVQALAKFLRSRHPHIVVANYGVHWHGKQLPGGEYYNDTARLLATLNEYAAERAKAKASAPLLLLRETFPQHFDGGSYDTGGGSRRTWSGCTDVPYDQVQPGVGPVAFNQLARAALRSSSQGALGGGGRPAAVRFYGRAFRALVPRKEAHLEGPGHDCTHWCYSPLLWDPVLAPFYEEVVEQFGGATISHA